MKKSLFQKIVEVTTVAARTPHADSKKDLQELVLNEGLELFDSWVYDEDSDEMVSRQSNNSIRNTINLAIDIGLVDSAGRPTKVGESCFSAEDFSDAIGEGVIERLGAYGISLRKLNAIVRRALKDGLVEFPTSVYLHSQVGGIAKARFGRYLSLLQSSGKAEVCGKKLYLAFNG